jgi:CubicO group peptidase (beta-lactamase class C family)
MLEAVAQRRAPSVSVALVIGDGPVIADAVGDAQLEPRRDATAATPYPWFSVTKLFTATAVLKLVESGGVELDDPITKYVPSFEVASSVVPSVRQLLAHTSGLPNPVPVAWIHRLDEQGPTLDQMTQRLLHRHRRLSFAPGTRFAYSNLNYLVLGQLIERVSGIPYETFVIEHVVRPLGANTAAFEVTPDAATGYSRPWSLMGLAARWMLEEKFFGPTRGGYTELRPFAVDGAPYGGLVGTPSEMLLLGRGMLGGGTIDGRTVLRPQTVDLALSPTKTLGGARLPIGLGWHLASDEGEPFVFHLGGGGGFRSELRVYPKLRCAIAISANETSFDTAAFTRLARSQPR